MVEEENADYMYSGHPYMVEGETHKEGNNLTCFVLIFCCFSSSLLLHALLGSLSQNLHHVILGSIHNTYLCPAVAAATGDDDEML